MFRCNSAAIIQAVHDEAERTRSLIIQESNIIKGKLDQALDLLKKIEPKITGIQITPGTPVERK